MRCLECHAVADCQTYTRHGQEWIGRSGIPIMPRHGKKLVHRKCGGSLQLFDIGDFRADA